MKEEPLLLIPWILKDKGEFCNLYENDQFLEAHNLQKLSPGEINTLNKLTSRKLN